MRLAAIGKTIPTDTVRNILRQGENLTTLFEIVLPAEMDKTSLAGYNWQIRAEFPEQEANDYEDVAALEGDGQIVVNWLIGDAFTIYAGPLVASLVGTKENKIIKFTFGELNVRDVNDRFYPSEENYFDRLMATIKELLRQTTLASNSARQSEMRAQQIVDGGIAQINRILLEGMRINDPQTGVLSTVQQVVYNLFSLIMDLHEKGGISAAEFDALMISAAELDAMQLSAYDFDTNGKSIFGG